MRVELQPDAVVFGNPLSVEIEFGVARDAAQVQNFNFDFFGRNSGALLGERLLHGRISVVEAQVSEIGAGMIPEFLVDDEEILTGGLRNLDSANIGEIGNGLLRPAGRVGDQEQEEQ